MTKSRPQYTPARWHPAYDDKYPPPVAGPYLVSQEGVIFVRHWEGGVWIDANEPWFGKVAAWTWLPQPCHERHLVYASDDIKRKIKYREHQYRQVLWERRQREKRKAENAAAESAGDE